MITRSRSILVVLLGLALVFSLSIAGGSSGSPAGADAAMIKKVKELAVVGRGERLLPEATTDVWALDGFAYIGTFNSPCGTGAVQKNLKANQPGIAVYDVSRPSAPTWVTQVRSVRGSRVNDVKVANMNSGATLMHSNEPCGAGGFEIYNVDNPERPRHLAHVQTDDVNAVLRNVFEVVDAGVHNLFLFKQGNQDYVAANAESFFGNFQIFNITDPRKPALVGAWGAEELCDLPQCSADPQNEPSIDVILDTIFDWMFDGYGVSRNRFLHDLTVSADGNWAYLSNWDAGLVLLNISAPTNPSLVSVALDPVKGSLDGEVNSHAAWPSADGRTVVETEEDFEVFGADEPLTNFTFQGLPTNTIPGVGISTNAGSAFEANQTGNNVTVTATSVTVNTGPLAPNVYPAGEGDGNQPKLADTGPITGEAVWIGRACTGDEILNQSAFDAGDIAVARRGACFFSDKLASAAALGASAIVIANNAPNSVWGGVRIWNYSNPANPVLVSTFNTVCSAAPTDASCDPRGTYTVHNVIVEGGKAYLSWYSDGVRVLDIRTPRNPKEIARFKGAGSAFEAQNGGIQDVWGIYKIPGEPFIYASDRNGGLYVLTDGD